MLIVSHFLLLMSPAWWVLQDEGFEAFFHTHLGSVIPFPSVALVHALPDFRYCSVCPEVWQLCPAGHREGQKTVFKFQSLTVNTASVSVSASFHTTGLKRLLS